MAINGIGAAASAVVLGVFLATKFVHGAWIVVALIPVFILMFLAIHRHYENVARQLAVGDVPPVKGKHNKVVIPVSRLHRGTVAAVEYALSVSEDVQAVYVEIDPAETP